jgi:hypothetical protein
MPDINRIGVSAAANKRLYMLIPRCVWCSCSSVSSGDDPQMMYA